MMILIPTEGKFSDFMWGFFSTHACLFTKSKGDQNLNLWSYIKKIKYWKQD